jgi:hypothetical protein
MIGSGDRSCRTQRLRLVVLYLAPLGLTIASWITPKIDGLCCELSELS